MAVPAIRIRRLNDAPIRANGRYVLYWMVAARRVRYNFALDRALELCAEFGCGLVVLEALRVDYPWASARLHRFVLDGMKDNARALADSPVLYYPYVEPRVGAGKGLLTALSRRARVVITDDFPCFFLPRMVEKAARNLDVRMESVDGNGLYPMRATERVFTTAASFRRHLQRELPAHLGACPQAEPLAGLALPAVTRTGDLTATITRRWRPARFERGTTAIARALPIDQDVADTPPSGGHLAGTFLVDRFLSTMMEFYHERRNDTEEAATSSLSPYLHFGHISAHEIFTRLVDAERWTPERLPDRPTGSRQGWWHMRAGAEAFLDQLITWRELGLNMCAHRPADYDRYESLPGWAQITLAEHENDPRPHLYSRARLEMADTHDPLWNAAQNQLRQRGVIHNYLRMLWGKKILEWSPTPRHALETLIELNNKYALDGRDPNSYSGIFWILGRYDRAWGPERPIFGKVRYMSSDSARRKLHLAKYLTLYTRYGQV